MKHPGVNPVILLNFTVINMDNKEYKVPISRRQIEIINPDAFFKSYQEYQSGKSNFAELSGKDFAIKQYETYPASGDFAFPPGFPDCCKWHKKIYEQAVEKFNNFPNCCDQHKKLIYQKWFDKVNYTYMPQKVINTIVYTIECVKSNIDHPNWYKEITDYIQYSIDSYGQFPFGYGAPLGLTQYISCIEGNIPTLDEVSAEKADRLLDFFAKIQHKNNKKKSPDLNSLVDIYKQWLRIFPFELSYLSHLKPFFANQIPIFQADEGETNLYSGLTAMRLTTKVELLEFLKQVTLQILSEINAVEVYKKGKLSEQGDTTIQLLIAKRKIGIETLDTRAAKNSKTYVKIIQNWLKDEREFVEDLSPMLADQFSKKAFLLSLTDGIRLLQSGDTNEDCLNNVRSKGANKESKVRYWFRTFFSARYKDAVVTAEEENGPGRMDLKIHYPNVGTRVIEFKGWWNQDKSGTPEQLINYLTDFESEGFIVMINHLEKKNIVSDYKKLVEAPITKFEPGSWAVHTFPNSNFSYFESRHKFGIEIKTIYHFILNVNF